MPYFELKFQNSIFQVKGEKPPPITRGAPPQQESVEDEEESAEAETVNVADLIPRNDIR